MSNPGWWASDRPLEIAVGRPFRSRRKAEHSVLLSLEDRTQNMYAIGGSGVGKSSWLQHLICQDIEANRGLMFVDPNGDLFDKILGYIAEKAFPGPVVTDAARQKLGDKLIVIEPALQRHGAPGVNLLQPLPGYSGYTQISGFIEVLEEEFEDNTGPRLVDFVRNGSLLLQAEELTLIELLPLLTDDVFRAALVERCRIPEVRLFFTEHLGRLRPAEYRTWAESTRNKISSFTLNPFLKPIFGQLKSTINFREAIDAGKWILIKCSRDHLRESRRLFGAVLVYLQYSAGISRENIPPHQRVFTSLICDEFQEYFSPSFIHALESGRKYGIANVLSHQNTQQPPFDERPGIVQTILANSATLVSFRVAKPDAEMLAAEMFLPTGREVKHQRMLLPGIPAEEPKTWSMSDETAHYQAELMRLRRAEVYVKRKTHGEDEPWMARVPQVPDIQPDPKKVEALRAHVASRYYRPVAQVEREITERWQRIRAGNQPRPPADRDWGR